MRSGTLLLVGVSAAVLAGCGGSSDPSPSPDPGGPPAIRGTERLGWDQLAADVGELNRFRYAIYVDGARSEMADTLCATVATPAGFSCSGRLPSMAPGVRTLELAAFVMEGGQLIESARSAPLQVTVAPGVLAPAADVGGPADEPSTQSPDERRFVRTPVAQGLTDIADMGVDPEGRLLIGEYAGVVRLVDAESDKTITSLVLQDTLASGGEGVLLGLALDPAFDRTRIIYVLQTASSRDGLTYQIVRYRGVAGIFGERAVLLETGRAEAAQPSGTIRVGADDKLYAAILEARGQREPGELRGVILRLNPDGTTPHDQLSGSPIFAAGARELRGLDWHPWNQRLWLAQDGGGAPPRLLSVARDRRSARAGVAEEDYPLPDTSRVSALRFYDAALIPSLRGRLLVTGDGGLHSVSFDPQDASRIVSIDRLLDIPLRAIAIAADGTLFVATSDTVFRAAPR